MLFILMFFGPCKLAKLAERSRSEKYIFRIYDKVRQTWVLGNHLFSLIKQVLKERAIFIKRMPKTNLTRSFFKRHNS